VAKQGSGDGSAQGLPRLPPGRHGLPREFVTRNQRDRLTAGIIAVVAEHGYHAATVTQIVEAAGLSRRTFYGYFSTKEECFLDTYDLIAGHFGESMLEAAASAGGEWPGTVAVQLAAILDAFAANPDLVRFCFVAALGAGERIEARYRLSLERLLAQLRKGMPAPPATREPSLAAEQAAVGGLVALLVRRVEAGQGTTLPELLPSLVELILAPYLGREEAARVAALSA
jgi:AcrR family transcriptional regulator